MSIEALELAEGPRWAMVANGYGPLQDAAVALAAEVRACHETIRRMIAEREAQDVELAKWRR